MICMNILEEIRHIAKHLKKHKATDDDNILIVKIIYIPQFIYFYLFLSYSTISCTQAM